jgi:hypothetical protein
MTATPYTAQWTTQTYQPDTSTKPSKESDAPAQNHPSDHTAEANAKTAKGTTMASMYEIEKQIEDIITRLDALAIFVGITPERQEQSTIEELTDPDA